MEATDTERNTMTTTTTTFNWLGGRTMLCAECAVEAIDEGQNVRPFTETDRLEMLRIIGDYRCDWCDEADN